MSAPAVHRVERTFPDPDAADRRTETEEAAMVRLQAECAIDGDRAAQGRRSEPNERLSAQPAKVAKPRVTMTEITTTKASAA